MIRRYLVLLVIVMSAAWAAESAAQEPTLIPSAVANAAHYLAARLGVPPERVQVVSLESVVWADGCLGLPAQEACFPGSTPGYRAILRTDSGQYTIHTDRKSSFRFAESRVP